MLPNLIRILLHKGQSPCKFLIKANIFCLVSQKKREQLRSILYKGYKDVFLQKTIKRKKKYAKLLSLWETMQELNCNSSPVTCCLYGFFFFFQMVVSVAAQRIMTVQVALIQYLLSYPVSFTWHTKRKEGIHLLQRILNFRLWKGKKKYAKLFFFQIFDLNKPSLVFEGTLLAAFFFFQKVVFLAQQKMQRYLEGILTIP